MSLKSDHVLDLLRHTVRIGARKVDLIDDRDNVEVMVKGEVDVRKCLRLDSLGRVNDKDRAVAGRKASGYLIVKVHMTWGIDQVEDILFAVLRLIDSTDCLGFDRDAALALELHIVENLCLHLTAC